MPIVPADRINPLIASFIQTDIQLTDIAEQHGIPLRELLEWLRSPEIAEILDLLDTLALRRARAVAAEARITALRRLDYLAASSDDPDSARHAAAAILRAAGPLQEPSAARPGRGPVEPGDEPQDPRPTTPAPSAPPRPARMQSQPRPRAAASGPEPDPAIADSRAPTTGAAQPPASMSERPITPREGARPSGRGPAP